MLLYEETGLNMPYVDWKCAETGNDEE